MHILDKNVVLSNIKNGTSKIEKGNLVDSDV